MKNIIFLIIGILLMSCQKEEKITPAVRFQNLYEIKDNPDDTIQHRVYKLYRDYNVSVYFNDTIGKTFLKTDSRGDSVFIYELLDMNYEFSSNSSSGKTFKYTYIADSLEKIKALDVVQNYLDEASKPLRPYALMIAKTLTVKESGGTSSPTFLNNKYGIMVVSQLDKLTTEAKRDQFVKDLILSLIKEKVANYEAHLEAFHQISKNWYYKTWVVLGGTTDAMLSTAWLTASNRTEEEKALVRSVVGKFGFVSGWKYSGQFSPDGKDQDLSGYLEVILNTSREQFVKLWGSSPLVMTKYEILYSIIAGELGVEL